MKGHILFTYKKENDIKIYIGLMDEDGSNLKELWNGEWQYYYESNGIRLMPFNDNKKNINWGLCFRMLSRYR